VPSGSACLPLPGGGAGGFAAQEAFAAVNRASLGRFEGNRGFTAALRALRGGFGFGKTGSRRTGALGLAGLATLGLILEVLVVEEVLFSRCENKIRVAIHAFEHAVLKLRHGLIPWRLSELFAASGATRPRLKRYPRFWFYSTSRRDFFRLRLRAKACLTLSFSPGLR
jgi:hypothetical protein